jgi:hypothetical protein
MACRCALVLLLLGAASAVAQQPTPLINSTPLTAPPPAAAPLPGSPSATEPPASPAPPLAPTLPVQAGRIFCEQNVNTQPANPASVAQDYRPFIGIFSDAAWNPQLCAALIVENIAADGTATITYVFGPMGSGTRTPGGVLHGTGIVKDGALLFQNSDGGQYTFQPFYADLSGRWTTPQGQTYDAIFKRAY